MVICTIAADAAEQGFLGISVYIDGDQFIPNQKAKSVVINRLVPHSPAHKAGLQLDDEILEVDGTKIPGSRMSEIRPLLDKRAGQTITLIVKKKTGLTQSYSVVLGPRPPQ